LDRAVASLAEAVLRALLAPADRLAVLEVDPVLLLLAHEVERVVVEDVAVLEDLDERAAAMLRRAAQDVLEVGAIGVDRPGYERSLRADGERQRIERPVQRPHRRRLRHL